MRIVRLVFPALALLIGMTFLSTTLVHAQVGKLEINKAVYGKEGLGKDVTQRLQKMIKDNTLDVKVTNITMGGDPNKGADKTLKVDYTYRGQRKQVVVKEGDRLKLP
jgi:DnaJ-like protein C11, C-terminal